jgi:hypothetical protein
MLVGCSLSGMTYLAGWGTRGPLVFGFIMGLGWLVVLSLAKVRRQGFGSLPHQNWGSAVWTILALQAALVVVAALIGDKATASATALIAAPLLVYAVVHRTRRTR